MLRQSTGEAVQAVGTTCEFRSGKPVFSVAFDSAWRALIDLNWFDRNLHATETDIGLAEIDANKEMDDHTAEQVMSSLHTGIWHGMFLLWTLIVVVAVSTADCNVHGSDMLHKAGQ